MDRLKVLFRLPASDRILLLRAAWLVGTIRIALYFVPFRSLLFRALKLHEDDVNRRTGSAQPVQKLAWAVTVASRWVPKATCLTQALALQNLLSRSGYQSKLEIGVTKDHKTGFEAHAWVVWENHIVIGGPQIARYTVVGSWSNAA